MELVIKGMDADFEPVTYGSVVWANGIVTLHPQPGHERTMERVRGISLLVDDGPRIAPDDPRWAPALPLGLRGSRLWAEPADAKAYWAVATPMFGVQAPKRAVPGRKALVVSVPEAGGFLTTQPGGQPVVTLLPPAADHTTTRRGSVQALLPPDAAAKIEAWRAEWLSTLTPEDRAAVREVEVTPHVTVRYGFLPSVTAADAAARVREAPPLTLMIAGSGVFEGAEDGTRDVLVAWVASEGQELEALHAALGALPHEDTHAQYVPHVTLAYVTAGAGDRLHDTFTDVPHFRVTVAHLEWRGADRVTEPLPLLGEDTARAWAKAWNEAAHPRVPAGEPGGGQFTGGGDARPQYEVATVEEAYARLTQQQRVILAQPAMVSTLLDKLASAARVMRVIGKNAPNINLCDVTVPGTNLFCEQHMGVPRVKMPQLEGKPIPGSPADALPRDARGNVNLGEAFLAHLVMQGITITRGVELASHLKATQRELNGGKVAALMARFDQGLVPDSDLVVSDDRHVVDGHHRWAARVGMDYRDGVADLEMPVAKINAPIMDVLVEAIKFTTTMGIPPSAVFAPAKAFTDAAVLKDWNEADHPREPAGSPEGGQFAAAGGASGAINESLDVMNEGVDEAAFREETTTNREKFQELKQRWAVVNNELLSLVDHPDSPEAEAKLDELKAIVKDTYRLDADPGTIEGIGLPGGPRDLVIVGAGPGGLAAAVMGGTDGLDTLLVDANAAPGGQAKYSSRIENYPGFPIGASGQDLADSMFEQAQRVGAECKLGVTVTGIAHDPATGLKTVTFSDGMSVQARAVVLAGGIAFRKASFPGADHAAVSYANAETLMNQGAGKPVVVLGGSNGAAQAALGAARKASRVTVVARSPIPKGMSDYQVQALRNHPKISIIEGDDVASYDGAKLTLKSGTTVPAAAVGIFWGGAPATKWLPSDIRITRGKVQTDRELRTTMPGVFAVGDIRDGGIGRVGAAVGEGQLAVRSAWSYFEQLGKPAAGGTGPWPKGS